MVEQFEPLKPIPLFNKNGEVPDERIARKMASTEMRAYEKFPLKEGEYDSAKAWNESSRQFATASARTDGLLMYAAHGMEIPLQNIPLHVLKTFELNTKRFGVNTRDTSSVEFRQTDFQRGDPQYSMDFDFKHMANEWHFKRITYGPNDVVSEIRELKRSEEGDSIE